MARRVEVVSHRSEWANLYEQEARTISRLLSGHILQLYHIGSTAIRGIYAKPIIDVMGEVRQISDIDGFDGRMLQGGYRPMGEYGIKGRRFYIKCSDEARAVHLHLFQQESAEIAKHLAFRDYLRVNPDVALQYSHLKRQLAAKHTFNIQAYMNGKDGFIRQVLSELGY